MALSADYSGRFKPLILGITGGVASGKSTLSGFFADRGARIVSADEVARVLLAPGSPTSLAVLAHFGQEFALEGSSDRIDRVKLARHIFANDDARRDLGAIMHPVIRERMAHDVEIALRSPSVPLVVAEIPLLFENGLRSTVDRALVARCSEATQLGRLRTRQPWLTEVEALRQIRSQLPMDEKARLADFVIDTDGPLDRVRVEADRLFDGLAAPA